jgi:hypothetical protein
MPAVIRTPTIQNTFSSTGASAGSVKRPRTFWAAASSATMQIGTT